MSILYIDCGMGAAGDMLTAALLELLPDKESFLKEINGLGIPGLVVEAEAATKCGITGTHMRVIIHGQEEDAHLHQHHEEHHHHHRHSGMEEIRHIVGHFALPEKVKSDVLAVYDLIAEAESHVHGVTVDQIHFHEVGSLDAIADVTAVCLLMYRLAPERVAASPVHVGSGTVKCAHGILPVPAPATAYLLSGVPIYGGEIRGELCTPTGAALLRHFVTEFGPMPVMRLKKTGYGMGKKDFPVANCVRAMLGETDGSAEQIFELACNLDDMSAEEIGFAMERLLDEGALDVYTVPIGMKKSRPATMLCVLCREQQREKMVSLLFQHTTTLGVRECAYRRYALDRATVTADTPLGPVRRKDSAGFGIVRSKYEYEDLAELARKNGMSLREVRGAIE